jgi:serine/threonine protein kinase
MRDLVRKILQGYTSLKIEGQDEGYIQVSGQEPDTRYGVSIKILPQALSEDPKIAARFEGLARTIRQLNHPNIASIRKVGQEAGLPYIVTRAIEKGQSLAAKLNQPWAVDAAADVVMQAGQALEHAYNKGVIHGALSPENIIVQDDGRVLVNDLGLSELRALAGGWVKGTASPFVAPERREGKPADARADVYSLAAILYGLLTQRTPQVVKGEVLPPSRFNTDVPQAMDQVLVKALNPAPADRYPDVKAFLAALGAVALVPAAEKASPVAPGGQCPRCGAENQTGRFCRKCGLRLEQPASVAPPPPSESKSVLDQPIQITRVEVGRVEMGKGIELTETLIAQPAPVAAGEFTADFPAPLEMPRLDMQQLWPSLGGQATITMPEPPAMPVIDWAEMVPPVPEVPTAEGFLSDEKSD